MLKRREIHDDRVKNPWHRFDKATIMESCTKCGSYVWESMFVVWSENFSLVAARKDFVVLEMSRKTLRSRQIIGAKNYTKIIFLIMKYRSTSIHRGRCLLQEKKKSHQTFTPLRIILVAKTRYTKNSCFTRKLYAHAHVIVSKNAK